MTDEAEIPEDEDEAEDDYVEPRSVVLNAGEVAIPDPDFLARDSGVQGVIAVRVNDELEVEYLDGETRLWLDAAIPAGPKRNKH